MFASTLRSLTPPIRAAGAALLLVLAQPVAAADFQLDNLRLDLGTVVIALPKVDVKGSALEREAFVALFNANTGETGTARMGRLTATEISAPELTVEQVMGPQKQVTTYRGIRLSDIREGRIARGESAGGAIAVTGGTVGAMSGDMKRMSFEGLDLKQMARVFSESAAPGSNEPMVTVFGRFEQDGYTLDMGPAGKVSLGKASGRDFKARPGREPLGAVFARILQQAEAERKNPRDPAAERDPAQLEADRRMGLAMLSMFEMFDYGSGEMRDIAMNINAPPKPGDPAVAVDMRIARIAYGEDSAAKSGYSMEGLSFAGGGAKGQIASMSVSGFSFGPVLKELQDLLAKPADEIDFDTIDYRKFVPTLGTFRLAGLSVDAPQETKPGQPAAAPIRIGLGTFEIKASEQLNGIPTNLAMTIDKLAVPVVEGTGNPAARDLIAMGYRNLDLSAKLDLGWSAASNEIAIRTLSFGGAGMGQFEAAGTLGNVTRDLFSSDMALAQVAALGATARSLQAKLQNSGLIEKLIENEARKAKRKPAEIKQQYAMMASLGLAAILGPSDAAKSLATAISRFVAQPGTLTVEAKAKSATGLGLADVIAIGDPTEIFEKIDLKANAQ